MQQQIDKPEILRVPGWDCYPWLRAGFSTRFGGESQAYGDGELNLGWMNEDDEASVAQNRQAFVREMADGAPMELVTVAQVHSAVVCDIDAASGPLRTAEGRAVLEGDGLLSASAGKLLAILTADCVPVLVADPEKRVVGAFHAGWRGTVGGIAQGGIAMMEGRFGCRPEAMIAAIGPCIRQCCFEVGGEVLERFRAEKERSETLFQPGVEGRYFMDLVEANRQQLLEAGLPPEAVLVVGGCTSCARRPDGRREFYSYRAEGGRCGRMMSAIGVVA